MIKNRRTSKNCDVCFREVAVKDKLTFRTTYPYYTIPMDFPSFFHHTDKIDAHICRLCWEEMASVSKALNRKERESDGNV